jgi:polysaccharide biosynthesis PFTS motif protein
MIKSIITFLYFNNFFEKKLEQAYKILEKNKQIDLVYKIKKNLKNIQYNDGKIDNSFLDYNLDICLALNQFIYSKLINTPFFTSKLIFAIAYNEKFYFPIPKNYLDIVNSSVKVSYIKSLSIFYLCLFIFYIYQLILLVKNILYFLVSKKKYEKKIYLNSIPDLYSDTSNEIKNLDFFKWVLINFNLNSKVNFFHCNKIIKDKYIKLSEIDYETSYIKDPLILFFRLSNLNFFIQSLFKTFYLSIKIMISFRLELLLLLKEIFSFYFLKKIPKQQFYDLCLFNNSNMVFRPLWTYVNEKKKRGSVILFFYSTNMMPLLHEINVNKYFEVYGYSLHSWPSYLTWNKDQKDWLEKNIKFKSKFYQESLVPFSGKHLQLFKNNKTLTIFDVPPKRPGIYHLLNNPYNIYTLSYCKKFLDDIIKSIPEEYYSKIDIILKLKKDYDNIDPSYRNLINNLADTKKVKLISDISPESVIEISDATISIPFTSTGLTSFYKNKDTIYYDPSGKLTKNNCLEKKIDLISSEQNLKKWILNILNK